MIDEEFPSVGREDVETVLASDDPTASRAALLGALAGEPDWQWLQDQCLRLIGHTDGGVRHVAATCQGELGLLRKAPLELERVLPALARWLSDPEAGIGARQAVEDLASASRPEP